MSEGDRHHPAGDAEPVRSAFEASPVGLAALVGPEHRFVAANAAYRALVGDRELLGRPMREVMPEIAGQDLYGILDRVFRSGEPETGQEWRMQFRRQVGGPLDEVYLDFHVSVLPARDGGIAGVNAFVLDVSDRVRKRRAAQEQAAEAQRRYQAARDVVAELQAALLPVELPVLPGARVEARYLVAEAEQQAGGDWFDAVPLPDGTLAVVVGDVVGHGVEASAAMARVRAVLDELLVESVDLEVVLARVDRLAARVRSVRAATLCVLVLDPATGAVRYSTCGHPPPLVVAFDGTARYLPATGGGPLGTGSAPRVGTASLAPAEVLLLYSDGLVERRGQSLQEGLDALARVAGDAVANRALPVDAPESAAERACVQTVELLTRGGYDDDVTMLGVQRQRAWAQPWRLEVSADPFRAAEVRESLRGWMRQFEPMDGDAQRLELAVTELVANVVEHAYVGAERGVVRLRGDLGSDGIAQIEVADDGTWVLPGSPEAASGRGLWVAGGVIDDLHLDHGADGARQRQAGTVVTVRHQLTRPALVASEPAAGTRHGRSVMEFSAQVEEGSPATVTVAGPIDIATAGRFAEELVQASRGGLHPLVVDLTAVEILASAGVRELFEIRDRLAVHDNPLTLVAAPGSPAQVVCELVGLAYLPDHPDERDSV